MCLHSHGRQAKAVHGSIWPERWHSPCDAWKDLVLTEEVLQDEHKEKGLEVTELAALPSKHCGATMYNISAHFCFTGCYGHCH